MAGTSTTGVELLGTSVNGGVGDGSLVIDVSDGVIVGCNSGRDEVYGGTIHRGVTSSTTVMGIEVVEEGGVGERL